MRLFAWAAIRVLAAALLTALVISVASAALFFTTTSAAVSLTAEPLSLLLVPGFILSLTTVGTHDVSAALVLRSATAFYFALFCFFLLRRPRTRKSHAVDSSLR